MKIAIHQPEHLPWLGFFDKMKQVDLYVFLDTDKFKKNGFQNRNRIPTGYLTVPVLLDGHTQSCIKDTKISQDGKWQRKYWGKFSDCYRKFEFFKQHQDTLDAIVNSKFYYLVEMNYAWIDFLRDCLKIKTPFVLASELDVTGHASALLIDICQKVNADTYLSGPSGADYLDLNLFKMEGVNVQFNQYPHSEVIYSAIDFLMQGGTWE